MRGWWEGMTMTQKCSAETQKRNFHQTTTVEAAEENANRQGFKVTLAIIETYVCEKRNMWGRQKRKEENLAEVQNNTTESPNFVFSGHGYPKER